MKTYKRLYEKLCSEENLRSAYEKAKKGKSRMDSVVEFTKNLDINLSILRDQLLLHTYKPRPLRRFMIRDPKTRVIHASHFCDRVVHHATINILEPIFEPRFIHDSFASRKDKGTHGAVERFDGFKRKVSTNGLLVREAYTTNGVVGYVLKTDIRHFFDTVDHGILLDIIHSKIRDDEVLSLIKIVLDNFETHHPGQGMPLGNYTSQFFANVYLNRLDYFVKHVLKARYYIRYVDDLVILARNKVFLEDCHRKIDLYLRHLKIELHPDKSSIIPLKSGVAFLGYRIFFNHKRLRKRNLRHFMKKFKFNCDLYDAGDLSEDQFVDRLQGWFGYAQWADTHNLREELKKRLASGGGANSKTPTINVSLESLLFLRGLVIY